MTLKGVSIPDSAHTGRRFPAFRATVGCGHSYGRISCPPEATAGPEADVELDPGAGRGNHPCPKVTLLNFYLLVLKKNVNSFREIIKKNTSGETRGFQ